VKERKTAICHANHSITHMSILNAI
jgi:hypothetical protein